MSNALKVERLRAKAKAQEAAGQLEEAERLYRRLLDLHRTDLNARHMIAVIRLKQGRAGDALALLTPLVGEAPGDADIRTHYGLALKELGRLDQAMADFNRALALRPDNALTLFCRGNLLVEEAKFEDALRDYDRLMGLAPAYDEGWFRRANALWLMEKFEEALTSYARALQLNPARFSAAFNSGTVLLKLERYEEAFNAFQLAGTLAPDHPYVLGGAASAVLGGCDLARWPQYQDQVIDAVANGSAVIAPLAFLPFCDDAALRRVCAEKFVKDRVPASITPFGTVKPNGGERIRIAYLSCDFRQHATAELIAGLIEHHDRTRFEIAAFSFGSDDQSAMRTRLMKAFDRFDDVRTRSNADVARLLRDGKFDIAVDLKGHTEGSRPGILAHRPCPVQVSYLGYPGTTAAPWLDYIIGDAVVLPFDRQPFYSEKIVHLPNCYQVNDSTRACAGYVTGRAQAGLADDGFVFCCFNAAWKISPTIFDIWMRLLQSLPGSVLWLLEDNRSAIRHLRAAAGACGIDPNRLVFAPRLGTAEHLARHRLADLFLDTVPYNAHTTASDAMWAGLPLLTCLGTEFDGRVAASLLFAMGLPEMVTDTLKGYEELALGLARDRTRLSGLRERLAANRRTSRLYDTDRFRKSIEAAFLRMVEIARRGGPAESFAVTD
jgi:protein O-GlcNAc transferase